MDSNALSAIAHIRTLALALVAALVLAPGPVEAGSSAKALITRLVVIPYDDVAILHTAAPVLNPATCPGPPSAPSTSWIFSVRTPGGRAMLNLLLHAQALGHPVLVNGTGVCKFWNLTREEVQYVVVEY